MARKVLRVGMSGKDVQAIQEALNKHGASLSTDGQFGPMTERAVVAFQKANNLVPDGVVGERTKTALNLVQGATRDPKALCDSDIKREADLLNVSVSMLMAISELESKQKGFFDPSHPAILYERHIFRRIALQNKMDLLVEIATEKRPDLVYGKMGGYRGGMHEWTRLRKASELNEDIAIQSCSWGRFQIMGMHWERLGYDSPKDFKEKMSLNEGEHLHALAMFIKADPALHRAFQRRDYVEVARRYNGPKFEVNRYHTKLEEADKRYTALLG